VPPRPSPVYLAVGYLTAAPVRLLLRMRWSGLENVPRGGGFVLAANHLSNFDPWAIGVPLFPRGQLHFMAKSELFVPGLAAVLHAVGAFPVRRGEGDTEAVATAVELCRRGRAVMMFPEGTRRRKGLRKRWRPRPRTGAARIALEAGVPLVPAAIRGSDRVWRLGPVRTAYGPPLDLADLAGRDAREAAEEATDRLMDAIRALERAL
jgi:1-acyl-sn-glycerol-3-phosphate acyltransferase